jgi:Rrf2 family protein
MFRISRRLDYGLQLMIALSAEPENRAQATAVLAEKLQIPLPFLHQIGRSLIQGRLIKATPGPHGGLRLNVPAEEITLLQIVETLEGPVCITPCLDGEACQRQETCASNSVWNSLQVRLIEHLSGIRLNSLASSGIILENVMEFAQPSDNGKSL